MLHGQTRYNLRSRFVEEIPPELVKWLTPPKARGYAAEPAFKRYYDPAPARNAAPRVAVPPSPSRDLGGLRVGQNVTHARFGTGVIVAAEGSGNEARVQVNFGRQGVKWLLLGVAKLAPA
jgi:DNA helicase-2/ATP-dependent DNA helicase PcrA